MSRNPVSPVGSRPAPSAPVAVMELPEWRPGALMPLSARYIAAQDIARMAGQLAREHFAQRETLVVEHKGKQDFVSHADRAVEALIAKRLAGAFPGDTFLGEETASEFSGDVEHVWIVDPIDGTHNFLRG